MTDYYNFIYHYRLDGNGDVDRISYSNQVRDSFMTTLAPEKVKPFYRALLLMNKLLYDNAINYKLNSGMSATQTIANVQISNTFDRHFQIILTLFKILQANASYLITYGYFMEERALS